MKITKKHYIYAGIVILLGIGLIGINVLYDEPNTIENNISLVDDIDDTTTNAEDFYVDIKGAVKKPGVYKVNDSMIVNDQTTPNMIQRLSGIFARNPLIYGDI